MKEKYLLQSNMENHILPLVDCRTLAVTNILNADNMNLDSEMVFVLCGGLDTWACKTSEHSKICIFITRNMSTEISFLERIGYKVDIEDNLPNERLVDLLKNGNRLIVDVDRFYLPNYVEAFGAQHFGFHCSNIIGYEVLDTNERTFYAFEFLREEPYTYPDGVLNEARFAVCDMYSPKARIYIVGKNPALEVSDIFFYSNLLQTAKNQLEGPVGLIANYRNVINQLNRTKAFIRNPMLEKLGKSQLNLTKDSIRKSDALGTGYRLPHANGLKKIADRCNDTNLGKIADQWLQLANEWKQAGKTSFHNASTIDKHSFWISFFTGMLQRETELYKDIFSLCENRL